MTQVPNDFYSNEQFERISEYVILKPSLCGRLTTVRDSSQDWVMGNSVCLRHSKFHRNALVFNACFVLDGLIPASQLTSFQNLVNKMSDYLAHMEIESEFVSSSSDGAKSRMKELFLEVFLALNKNSWCILRVDETNTWHFKVDPVWEEPCEILQHEVPVPIVDLQLAGATALLTPRDTGTIDTVGWDMSIQAILPHVNGVNYVKKIALLANQDYQMVVNALRHLVYYNCVKMADIFQFSNRYRVTTGIRSLHNDPNLADTCLASIALDRTRPLPQFSVVFALYCQLQPGTTMHRFCERVSEWNIDVRLFIIFGVMNGLIKRVYKYPLQRSKVPLSQVQAMAKKAPNGEPLLTEESLQANMDGKSSFDEMCAEYGLSFFDLEVLFEQSMFK